MPTSDEIKFGISLTLLNGDLVLDNANVLETKVDLDNSVQGIGVLLQTQVGENFFDIDFGLDFLTLLENQSGLNNEEQSKFLELLIKQSCLSDDRVKEVIDVRYISLEDRILTTEIVLLLFNNTEVDLYTAVRI